MWDIMQDNSVLSTVQDMQKRKGRDSSALKRLKIQNNCIPFCGYWVEQSNLNNIWDQSGKFKYGLCMIYTHDFFINVFREIIVLWLCSFSFFFFFLSCVLPIREVNNMLWVLLSGSAWSSLLHVGVCLSCGSWASCGFGAWLWGEQPSADVTHGLDAPASCT